MPRKRALLSSASLPTALTPSAAQPAAALPVELAPILFDIPTARRIGGNLGRTTFFNLMKEGHFRTAMIGGRRMVDAASYTDWLRAQISEAA